MIKLDKFIQIRTTQNLRERFRTQVPEKLRSKLLRVFIRKAVTSIIHSPMNVLYLTSGEYKLVMTPGETERK